MRVDALEILGGKGEIKGVLLLLGLCTSRPAKYGDGGLLLILRRQVPASEMLTFKMREGTENNCRTGVWIKK